MIYRAVAATCPGRKSEHNSNNFYLNSKYITEEYKSSEILLKQKKDQGGLQFYALAEGKGSDSYANEASLIAMKKLSNLHEHWKEQDIEGDVCDALQGYIENYIDEANQAICARQPSGAQAKSVISTLAVLGIKDKDVIACNLGNTRIYLYRKGSLTQLSCDHNQAQRMVDLGIITQDQVEGNPKRKRLTQYLGPMPSSEHLDPNCVEIHTQQGDMFFLCSMTFCDVVKDEVIRGIFAESHSLSEIADRLMNQASEKGLVKDTSIMIVRAVKDVPGVATKGVGTAVAGAVVGTKASEVAVNDAITDTNSNFVGAESTTGEKEQNIDTDSETKYESDKGVQSQVVAKTISRNEKKAMKKEKTASAVTSGKTKKTNINKDKKKNNDGEKLWPALVIFGISLAVVVFLAVFGIKIYKQNNSVTPTPMITPIISQETATPEITATPTLEPSGTPDITPPVEITPTPTLEPTITPEPTATPTQAVTPTHKPTATPPVDDPTPTPTPPADDPTPTPTPPADDPTPTPTPPADDPTPTPTPPADDPTPTPTPPVDDPTPTPTPPADDPTPTPTPPAQEATPESATPEINDVTE